MKKINELKSERSTLISQMEEILKNETVSEEQRSTWNLHDAKVKEISTEIETLERQEALNKLNVDTLDNVPTIARKPIGESFREWLNMSVDNGGKGPSFRADPIITSTDSTVINKVVANSVDILKSPAEAFLKELGITFYTGLTNTLVLPYMAEDTAAFPGENTQAASANMATASLTLAPRRVSHTQSISKETLVQTNPAIYASILQNLYDGIWNAVANDVFDTIQTDAPAQVQTAGITYAAIAAMEASLAYTNIGTVKYVTTPANKATLKVTAKMANQAPIWDVDNKVLGYPAYGVPAANAAQMYMGDFSRAVIGQWGGVEIIVDPYTSAANGLIKLTVIGMFDTGIVNPKAMVWKASA
jgi:HK97 family phage major capsid protein